MKKMRLFMLLALVLVCLSGIASAHSWDWVFSTDKMGVYYSRGSAVRMSDNRQAGETGHVKAWFEFRYEDENMRQEQARTIQEHSDKDTSDFYHDICQYEFKNVNGKIYYRVFCNYGYDYSGKRVYELNEPTSWQIIDPLSNGMKMYERALGEAR